MFFLWYHNEYIKIAIKAKIVLQYIAISFLINSLRLLKIHSSLKK